MIKKGLKNYFANLKFYFTPIGMLAIGVILGLSIAIPVILNAVRDLVNYVSSQDSVALDFSAFVHKIFDAVFALNWRSPTKALATMLSSHWLNETFSDSIFALVHDVEPVAQEILAKIGSCVSAIKYASAAVVVFALVGLVGSFFLTKYLVRREIARCAFWKRLLASLFDAVITIALPVLSIYLSLLWRPLAYFVIVLVPILWGVILLVEAFLMQGYKKVKAKEVVTAKNSAKLYLTNLLILLIASAILSVVSAVVGELVGMIVGFPFLLIALIVCGLNAESYVKELAKNAQSASQAEQPASQAEQEVAVSASDTEQPHAEQESAAHE